MCEGSSRAGPRGVGASLPGGGEGPELTAVLELLPGLDQGQLDGLVRTFQDRLARHTVVAEEVDSLEVALEALKI